MHKKFLQNSQKFGIKIAKCTQNDTISLLAGQAEADAGCLTKKKLEAERDFSGFGPEILLLPGLSKGG